MKTLLRANFLATCLALGVSARAQNYALDWHTIDGGGGTSTGGAYSLAGTIGQPDAGTMSGGAFSLVGGFWGIAAAVLTPAPVLSVAISNGTVVVSWPQSAGAFTLEQTGALASPPSAILWSTIPAGSYQTNATHIFITVPLPSAKHFYRLRGP